MNASYRIVLVAHRQQEIGGRPTSYPLLVRTRALAVRCGSVCLTRWLLSSCTCPVDSRGQRRRRSKQLRASDCVATRPYCNGGGSSRLAVRTAGAAYFSSSTVSSDHFYQVVDRCYPGMPSTLLAAKAPCQACTNRGAASRSFTFAYVDHLMLAFGCSARFGMCSAFHPVTVNGISRGDQREQRGGELACRQLFDRRSLKDRQLLDRLSSGPDEGI